MRGLRSLPPVLVVMMLTISISHSAQFNFTPRTSVSGQYTDNVFRTKEDREDEFITQASAGFTAELLGKTSGLSLSANPSYVWYQEYSEKNTWRLPVLKKHLPGRENPPGSRKSWRAAET